jgi:hypothetical protein
MRATVPVRLLVVMTAMLATSATGHFPAADASPLPALEQLDGRLMVAHGDNFAGGPMVMKTELRTATGIIPLVLPAAEHSQLVALAGDRVRVLGSRRSSSAAFTAQAISPITKASSTSFATAHAVAAKSVRSMRIAVVLMRLPGSAAEPVTKAAVQAATFGATNSVAHWFSQMSGGQVAVTGKVYGYFNGVKGCDLAVQGAAAAAAAAPAGYVASDYDHLVVYAPSQVCGFKGMGWVGANGAFLNGTINRGVMEHELGHNLGLLHAGRYACGVAPVSASCLIDYGDPTDVMGGSETNRGYSAEHKYKLGWLPEAEVKTVTTGTQTIALTASENPLIPGSTQLIHVRAADGTLFAIDRRASVGYDTGLSGVWIRRVAVVNTDDTQLVRSSALAPGQSFIDDSAQVAIKTLTNVAGSAASIKVCVGSCPDFTTTGTGPVTPVLAPVTARTIASASVTSATNKSLTITVPAGRGVVIGHTVVVATYTGAAAGAVSCNDSRGNVYSVNGNRVNGRRLIVCSAHVSTSLPPGTKITTRYPAFNGGSVSNATDMAGIRATARVDKVKASAGSTTAVTSGATAPTTRAAEVVFGVEMHQGTPTFASSPVYTRLGGVSAFAGAARMTITPAFRIVSATGAYTFGGSLTSAQPWSAAAITFFRG